MGIIQRTRSPILGKNLHNSQAQYKSHLKRYAKYGNTPLEEINRFHSQNVWNNTGMVFLCLRLGMFVLLILDPGPSKEISTQKTTPNNVTKSNQRDDKRKR